MALYAADGSLNVTVVDGTTYVGRRAPDGSINVVESDGTSYTGLHHPSGAMYVVLTASPITSIQHPSGAWYVSTSPYQNGSNRVTVVSGSFGGSAVAPVLAMDPLWTSSDNTPDFTIDISSTVAAGDNLNLQTQLSGGSWSSLVTDTNHTITAPEDTADEVSLGLSAFSNNNYEARARVNTGSWSNTVSFTISAVTDAPETTAFLARTSGLDATHTNAYKALINGLVSDGVFAKLDAFYVLSTQDATTARLNIKSTSYSPLGLSGTPTFAADRGYTFNGSNFLTSGFTPSTAGGLYTQNSAHVMVWSNTTGNTTGGEIGSVTGANSLIITNGVGTNSQFQVNTNTGLNNNTPTGKGFFLASRTASNNTNAYWGASGTLNSVGSSAAASTALTSSDMAIGAVSGFAGTTKQISAASFGQALTGTDASNFYSRLQTFMTAVGN